MSIGLDMVEINRISSAIDEFGMPFLEKIFSPREIAYCQSRRFPSQHFAVRFAGKEAVGKALEIGVGREIDWTEIEIVRKANGVPKVRLHGKAKAYATSKKVKEAHVSLTHTRELAVASALVLFNRDTVSHLRHIRGRQ